MSGRIVGASTRANTPGRKRNVDKPATAAAAALAVKDQALRILAASLAQFDNDPMQAIRAAKQQAETLKALAIKTSDTRLGIAATGLEACLAAGHPTKASLVGPIGAILALAEKVDAVTDTKSLYPTYCSGGVSIRMKDGTEYHHHEPVNRGAGERALSRAEIEEKFFGNARLAVSTERAEQIRDAVYKLDKISAREFAAILTGR